MNNPARPIPYVTAYPLRAYTGTAPAKPNSPYLNALLSGAGKTRTVIRLFPMVKPHAPKFRMKPHDTEKIPSGIERSEISWFNHYE